MSLYKYLPPDRIDVFAICRVRFSQPAVFNDPFEAYPYVSGIAPRVDLESTYARRFERVLRDQYDHESDELRARVPFESFRQQLEFMRGEIYEIFLHAEDEIRPQAAKVIHDAFGKKIGVLSLSEVRDCPLMWAHYTTSHTGYVIEFDGQHPFFSHGANDPDAIWKLHKVTYASQRPVTTASAFEIDKILLTKATNWHYEREWRMLKPLNAATRVLPAKPYAIHLFEFPSECIKAVILGARMNPMSQLWFREKIKLHPSHKHIVLYRTEIDQKNYKFNFTIWK